MNQNNISTIISLIKKILNSACVKFPKDAIIAKLRDDFKVASDMGPISVVTKVANYMKIYLVPLSKHSEKFFIVNAKKISNDDEATSTITYLIKLLPQYTEAEKAEYWSAIDEILHILQLL